MENLTFFAVFLPLDEDFTVSLVNGQKGPVYKQQQVLASNGTLLLWFSLLLDNGVLASLNPQTFSK